MTEKNLIFKKKLYKKILFLYKTYFEHFCIFDDEKFKKIITLRLCKRKT